MKLLKLFYQRYYGANKCLYTLERFDSNGFNPLVHNKYVMEKHKQLEKEKKRALTFMNYIEENVSGFSNLSYSILANSPCFRKNSKKKENLKTKKCSAGIPALSKHFSFHF